MQMLKKFDVNDATLANIFLETKALQEFLADPVFIDERGFYDLSHDVIREVYGEPVRSDFDNISSMCSFFTPKQNACGSCFRTRASLRRKRRIANLSRQTGLISVRGQSDTPDHLMAPERAVGSRECPSKISGLFSL